MKKKMEPRISVCMAVRNGESFLHEQISSILPQLAGEDELILSDDHSSDNSLSIVHAFGDTRIRVVHNPGSGIVSNFENAMRHSTGEFIFLADQDDVWMPQKVDRTLEHLRLHDLVVSDCVIVDESLTPLQDSFFMRNNSRSGLLRNLFRNSYMGCCMAFRRNVMEKALPFPRKIPMHDAWIGLIGEIYFKVKFTNEKFVLHRRHKGNATTTSALSGTSLRLRAGQRFRLLKEILGHSYAF